MNLTNEGPVACIISDSHGEGFIHSSILDLFHQYVYPDEESFRTSFVQHLTTLFVLHTAAILGRRTSDT